MGQTVVQVVKMKLTTTGLPDWSRERMRTALPRAGEQEGDERRCKGCENAIHVQLLTGPSTRTPR
jgi:hypothetical protein